MEVEDGSGKNFGRSWIYLRIGFKFYKTCHGGFTDVGRSFTDQHISGKNFKIQSVSF